MQTILEAIRTVITTVWTAIQTAVTTVVNAIKMVIDTVWTAIQTKITTVVNTIKTVVTTVFTTVKTTASSIWNGIKSAIETAIDTAKNTVSTAVNAVKTTVTTVFNALKSTVTTVWNGIKSAIETPINAAKTAVQNAINAMRNAFNFQWSLPSLKLPHFSIYGSFSINPPSVPHFSVDWYKSGGIMLNPTMFGMNGNRAMVGGEAGAEAILPLEGFYTRLNQMLDKKLQAIQSMTNVYVENHTYIDSDEVSNYTVSKVDNEMVTNKRKGR